MSGTGPFRIVAINPGATSTKYGVFMDDVPTTTGAVAHSETELAPFATLPVTAQLDMRLAALLASGQRGLEEAVAAADAVVGRGGLLEPLPGGTYVIDDDVIADLRAARRGEHASNLGPMLARRLAATAGCPAYLVDPVSVDEWPDVARYTGLAGIERESLSHALNSRAVARRHARRHDRSYDALRLVVVHMGTGITVSAHAGGRMVDACNSMDEGPFGMDRAGGLPVSRLLELAESVAADKVPLRRRIFGGGGVQSYLGTSDLRAVIQRIDDGDEYAADVINAMLYQVVREAGAMAAVLDGRLDAVLLTGGMVHAASIAERLAARLSWLAPVHTYPGEDELRALAEGALRVLRGEQPALRYAEHRLPRRRLRTP
ncbi:MAG TPA: butyrate kinase [Longimicrobiales bacterium]|nr:butyrate kinase [Longimicrobiales bacterium]